MNDRTFDRRRHPRHEISIRASLHAAGVVVPCHVRNISAGGVLVEANAQLRIGDRTKVTIPEFGAVAGWVVRVSSTTVGIAFEESNQSIDRFVAEWLTLQSANADQSGRQAADEGDRQAV